MLLSCSPPGCTAQPGYAAPTVLEALTRWSCLAFLGLPGRMAEVFCAAGSTGPGPRDEGPNAARARADRAGCLPAVLDRTPVDPLDVAVGAYRPAELGRPRSRAAVRRRALTDPRTLPGDGVRPEDALVRERSEGLLIEERHASEDPFPLFPRQGGADSRRSAARSRRTMRSPMARATAADAPDLVRRFDLVLQTVGGPSEPEWDLPLDPATPVLQSVRRADGRIFAVALERWSGRWCRDCLLSRAAGAPVLDAGLLAEAVARRVPGPTGLEQVVEALRAPDQGREPSADPDGRDARICCCRLGGDLDDAPLAESEAWASVPGPDPEAR